MTTSNATTPPLAHAGSPTAHRTARRPGVAPRAAREPDDDTWVDPTDDEAADHANEWARGQRRIKFKM